MLKKAHRISSRRLISLLFKKGKVYKSKTFIIYFLPSLHNLNQFAVIVSRKVSREAVKRNRIKRQVTEVLRLKLTQFQPPIVALVMVRPSASYTYPLFDQGISEFLQYKTSHLK